MSSVDVKEPVLKGYDLAWIFLAGAIVAVTRHVVLQNPQHSLEWEDGRRKAKSQFTIKPTAHVNTPIRFDLLTFTSYTSICFGFLSILPSSINLKYPYRRSME